jgi:hypothetical protein
VRQLARLAHRHEARVEEVRDRRRGDEAPGLDAQDPVDVAVPEGIGEAVDRGAEGRGVGEERRDVLEDDPGLREVGDVADQLGERRPTVAQRRFPFLRGRGGWLAE